MVIRGSFVLAAMSAALVGPLGAQASYCFQVPGAAFGIQGYQCANCGFRTQSDAANTYTFFAEPVVTQAAAGARVESGDVIVAVDGNPITTQAGADRFTYPTKGVHTLTIRRGRDRQDVRVDVQPACNGTTSVARAGGGFGGSSSVAAGAATAVRGGVARGVGGGLGGGRVTAGGGSGYSVARTIDGCPGLEPVRLRANGTPTPNVASAEPLIIVDGVVQSTAHAEQGGRFGFAVSSRPVCRMEQVGGRTSYRHVFEEYPTISAIRPESAADKAGLRTGDVIVRVEGESVLDHPARLTGADVRNDLHLTVRRDGKDMNVVMVVTP